MRSGRRAAAIPPCHGSKLRLKGRRTNETEATVGGGSTVRAGGWGNDGGLGAGSRQAGLCRPDDRRAGAIRQGHAERRDPGHRRVQRHQAEDRRQGREIPTGVGRRPGRPEDRHHRRAEAGGRRHQGHARPFQLGHQHPGLARLQPGRHRADRHGDGPGIHQAGLQDHLSHDDLRHPAGFGGRHLRRQEAGLQEHRHRR